MSDNNTGDSAAPSTTATVDVPVESTEVIETDEVEGQETAPAEEAKAE